MDRTVAAQQQTSAVHAKAACHNSSMATTSPASIAPRPCKAKITPQHTAHGAPDPAAPTRPCKLTSHHGVRRTAPHRTAPAVTPGTRRLAAAGCCRVAAGVCAACHNSTLAKCNSSNSHAQPYPQHHDTSPPTAPVATPPPHPSHSTTPKTERHRTCRDSRHTPIGCCRLLPRRCRGLCCLWGRSGWVPCATACCCPSSPVGRIAALRCCQDCARHCAALTLQSQHSNSSMRMGVLVR